jgi:hypothetical protein
MDTLDPVDQKGNVAFPVLEVRQDKEVPQVLQVSHV